MLALDISGQVEVLWGALRKVRTFLISLGIFSILLIDLGWGNLDGFWLFSIRDSWWPEKSLGQVQWPWFFCLFLIIDKALGLELLLHLPAGEAATALHWKWKKKKNQFPCPFLSGTFFWIKNPLVWAIKWRLFFQDICPVFLSILIPFFLQEEGTVWNFFFPLLLSCLLRDIYLTARCCWRLNIV